MGYEVRLFLELINIFFNLRDVFTYILYKVPSTTPHPTTTPQGQYKI